MNLNLRELNLSGDLLYTFHTSSNEFLILIQMTDF